MLSARLRSPLALIAAIGLFTTDTLAHVHVEIIYREGQLGLVYYDFDYGESDPATVTIPVALPAARPVPNLPAYTNLLGEAGSTVWILPQAGDPELVWLGIGSEGLRSTDFAGGLRLRLESVDGPGHFALFFTDPVGMPQPVMNLRDGVSEADALSVPLGSHLHCNWAFSAPGRYRVRFVASGTLRAGNTPIVSAPTEFVFEVVGPPSPVLGLRRGPANTLELELEAHPGLNYRLERTDTFADWSHFTNQQAVAPVTVFRIEVPSDRRQFYRARLR